MAKKYKPPEWASARATGAGIVVVARSALWSARRGDCAEAGKRLRRIGDLSVELRERCAGAAGEDRRFCMGPKADAAYRKTQAAVAQVFRACPKV